MSVRAKLTNFFKAAWTYLPYAWALRVPIGSAIVLICLPTFGFSDGLRPFVSGLFDPISRWGLSLVTALALFNAWAIGIITVLTLADGADRLGLPATGLALSPAAWGWVVGSSVFAVPIVVRTSLYSSALAGTAWIAPLAAGFGIAAALLALAYWISRQSVARQANSLYDRFLQKLSGSPFLSAGLIRPRGVGSFSLRPGHGLAFGLSVSSVCLYVLTGILTRNLDRPILASALAYALLVVLMLTWLVGALAFFFDRIRVPVMLLFAAWVLIVTYGIDYIWPTDHVYRTAPLPAAAVPAESVGDVLNGTRTPIVVAVSGGGIQAAAWTARVLTALDRVDGFRSNVRLVSAVSGGSVGTMDVLASWPDCGASATPAVPPFDANSASRESSLHAVGWGLAFRDLPRAFLPWFSNLYADRSSTLEDAWKRAPRLRRPVSDPSQLLTSWRNNVSTHRCPGVVFNAMVAETGKPMLFPTVALPPALAGFSFYTHYPGRDLPMTTAVRLSSTFPFVSAAARADADDSTKQYSHLVDGGYFDNYGVSTLTAITDAALGTGASQQPGHLLILEVCDALACSGASLPPAPSAGGQRRAWPYQLRAPISALVAMRSSAQRVTNRTTLELLVDDWRAKATCIETVPVPFGSDDAPMSWHLTEGEKGAIDATWLHLDQAEHVVAAVSAYVHGGAATAKGQQCLAAVAKEQEEKAKATKARQPLTH